MMVRVVSLFSGGGFADYALHRASEQTGIPVDVVFACDIDPKAVEVYNANLPTLAVVADVKQMHRSQIPRRDLTIGGPPCVGWSPAGMGLGHADPRDCLQDFLRMVQRARRDYQSLGAWVMENVRGGLVNSHWSKRLCAVDFGDVTDRRRWFYSSHDLDVIPTPGPRRVRDIREDAQPIGVRAWTRDDGGNAAREMGDDDVFPSLTRGTWSNTHSKALREIAMRSHGKTARIIANDGVLGSVTATTHHGLGGVYEKARCPSLLEMARAHSIPDSWDWAGATKTQRGLLIANGWPIGMGTAVLAAMLRAVVASRETQPCPTSVPSVQRKGMSVLVDSHGESAVEQNETADPK